MSDDVKLTYKRVGEKYVGDVSYSTIEDTVLHVSDTGFPDGASFAEMMTMVHRLLVQHPKAGLIITRTDREGLLHSRLEPALLQLLRDDPVAYIKANTVPDRVLDLSGSTQRRMSKLAASDAHVVPKSTGLRHGYDTLADAFGEVLYTKARAHQAGLWRYEHPATGRWADLATIEHWLGSHDTEVHGVDDKHGWLLLKTELVLKTHTGRFYYPREWNDFGSWITKDQLQKKLEQFRKDKANVTR